MARTLQKATRSSKSVLRRGDIVRFAARADNPVEVLEVMGHVMDNFIGAYRPVAFVMDKRLLTCSFIWCDEDGCAYFGVEIVRRL